MADITGLIKKMLTRGLSGQEKVELSEQREMRRLLSEQWEESANQPVSDRVARGEMWSHIAEACWGKTSSKRVRPLIYMYAAAATVALLIVGTWIVNLMADSYITVSAPADVNMVCTLPDSSKVWLNVGSTIRYPKKFLKNREVELEGEAFFRVTKRSSSTFRVLFDEASVEVKGTEFNVKSGEETDEITLFRGSIVFSAAEIAPLEMKPYEQVVYDVAAKQATLSRVDVVEYDWRSTDFRFRDKPLKELVEFLNRTYKVRISIRDKEFEKMRFSGSIRRNESLSDVLEKVGISSNLHRQADGDSIILY